MRWLKTIILILLLIPSVSYAVDVHLYWEESSGATGYYIYYSTDSGTTWSAAVDASTATDYNMTGMSEAGVVLFCVNAYYSNYISGKKCQSGAWYDYTQSAAGAYAPTDLEFNWDVTGASFTAISGNDGYKIYAKIGSNDWVLINNIGTDTTYSVTRIFNSLVLYRASGYIGATEHINYRSGVWTNWPDTKPSRFRR